MRQEAWMADTYQHVVAVDDVNGNPRRCWAVYRLEADGGRWAEVVEVIDDDCAGKPEHLRHLVELPAVHVSISEYKRFLAMVSVSGRRGD
jgi:hypothetical protein